MTSTVIFLSVFKPPAQEAPLISHLQSSAQDREHRISINENESVAEFVKQTKDGGISLHLLSPEGNDSLPTYGNAGVVEGTVIVSKSEEIVSIDVKVCTSWCKASVKK